MNLRNRRILIKPAEIRDAEIIAELWNDPDIMAPVGFPDGLCVSTDDIHKKLTAKPASMLNYILSVRLIESDCVIGQALMHSPDTDGIGVTDIKLLKKYQGKGFGTEVKQTLINYLFQNTPCHAVEGTPNLSNLASISMQEAVGGIRIGRGRHQFQSETKLRTTPVDYWIYRCYKQIPPYADIRNRRIRYAAIVPAAGRSSRMGKFKPLLPWPPGESAYCVLESTINSLMQAGIDPIIIVTGHRNEDVSNRLKDWPVQCIHNPDSQAPMGSSISLAAKSLKQYSRDTAILLLPGDHPQVNPETIRMLIQSGEKQPEAIHVPVFNGKGGHPALFPSACRAELESPDPDQGLRAIIHGNKYPVIRWDVQDSGVVKNLDHPEDYR